MTAADGPLDSLLAAFWRQVARDLAAGCRETRAWLDGDGFTWWCRWSFASVEPATVRAWLLEGQRRAA